MTFGQALEGLKNGERVFRGGWNGKDMWLALIGAHDYEVFDVIKGVTEQPRQLPWIGMRTADGGFVPWLASQTDILAEDWRFAA